jgi:zinc protease
MTKDTQNRDGRTIAETLEGIGGYFVPFSSLDSFGIDLEGLSPEMDRAVPILEEALTKPLFDEFVFEREKNAQLAAIRDELDDIFNVSFRHVRKMFFGRHPYAVGPMGTEETVRTIQRSDVLDAVEHRVVGRNLVFSVVTSHPFESVVSWLCPLAEKISDQPLSPIHRNTEVFLKNKGAETKTLYLGREQALVLKAYPACGRRHNDFYSHEVVEEWLNGPSSEFIVRVREKLGLSYQVGATYWAGLERGMFCLFAGTHESHVARIEEEMCRVMDRLRRGEVAVGEFESAVVRLKVRHRTRMQSMGKRAAEAGFNVIYGLTERDVYEDRLNEVTADAIVSVSNRCFTEDGTCTVRASSLKKRPLSH